MTPNRTLVIRGAHSSPYSRKMRAVLRYRHVPHDWVVRGSTNDDLPPASVPVIPVIAWRDDAGQYHDVMADSSPQITELEARYQGRSIVPVDPATAFLDFVLEDVADEWVSKMMYHYRWANTEVLWWDPTPTVIAVERAPRSIMWNQWMDDLSWWRTDGDGGWVGAEDLPETTRSLFADAGRTYAPFMVANAVAVSEGADEVVCEIEGAEYRQAPFKYQAKCLAWIHEEYGALSDVDRARVDDVLAGTGCEVLVAS